MDLLWKNWLRNGKNCSNMFQQQQQQQNIDPTPHLYWPVSLLLRVNVLLLKREDVEGRHSGLLCVFSEGSQSRCEKVG